MKAELLYRLAWNGHHAIAGATDLHFDGSESGLLLQPLRAQVQIELAVQKIAEAADIEKAAAGSVADALECQIHVGLSKVDNNRFGLDFNIGCGLSRIAKCNNCVR